MMVFGMLLLILAIYSTIPFGILVSIVGVPIHIGTTAAVPLHLYLPQVAVIPLQRVLHIVRV